MNVETYTTANGSNMDNVSYRDGLTIEEVAADLVATVDGWDYAHVTDGEGNDLGTIWRTGDGFEVGREDVSALVDEGTVALENSKSRSGSGHWSQTILSATDDGNGNVTLDYATPDEFVDLNSNTVEARYELSHGMWDGQMGDQTTGSIGIDWGKVKSVSGQTFMVKDLIKRNGFAWDGKTKTWKRA